MQVISLRVGLVLWMIYENNSLNIQQIYSDTYHHALILPMIPNVTEIYDDRFIIVCGQPYCSNRKCSTLDGTMHVRDRERNKMRKLIRHSIV
jgi:hypothetical protein